MLTPTLKFGRAMNTMLKKQFMTSININLRTPPKSKFLKCGEIRALSSKQENYYDIIGVSRSATQQDIKRAYFQEAKKCHPDLNPNNPKATERFQNLASAYEVLSDPSKRKQYDSMGSRFYQQSQGQQTTTETHSRETFNSVWEDIDVLKEAWGEFFDDTKEEMEYALKAADNGDFKPLWGIASANKFIIIGVLVPVVAVFRFPALIAGVFRIVAPFAGAVGAALIRSGHAPIVAAYLWRKMISIAKRRRTRRK
jgi:hypothetical protein